MCMNTSPNVLESLRLLRFIGIDISWNWKLEKDLFIGHLQLLNVTVKTICTPLYGKITLHAAFSLANLK